MLMDFVVWVNNCITGNMCKEDATKSIHFVLPHFFWIFWSLFSSIRPTTLKKICYTTKYRKENNKREKLYNLKEFP